MSNSFLPHWFMTCLLFHLQLSAWRIESTCEQNDTFNEPCDAWFHWTRHTHIQTLWLATKRQQEKKNNKIISIISRDCLYRLNQQNYALFCLLLIDTPMCNAYPIELLHSYYNSLLGLIGLLCSVQSFDVRLS